MRVERANFTSKNRIVRAWSIKVRVSNSSGKRKRKKTNKTNATEDARILDRRFRYRNLNRIDSCGIRTEFVKKRKKERKK